MNLEQLRDQYVIVPAEGAKALEAIEDLRELEGDFGRGIKLLWSDEGQSIVGYAFAKSQFDQTQAQAWVDEYTKAPAKATVADIVRSVIQAMVRRFPIAAKQIEGWFVSPAKGFALADEGASWSFTAAEGNAVLGDDDWARLASAHLMVDMGDESGWPESKSAYKLPVAKMSGGKLTYYLSGAQAAYGAMRGARTGGGAPKGAPQAARQSALNTLKKIYRKFGRDTDEMSLTSFTRTEEIVRGALRQKYGDPLSPYGEMPWIMEIGPETAIVELKAEYYSVSYIIGEDDEVTLGEPEKVDCAWVRDGGKPIQLVALSLTLGDGDEVAEDDGLTWKEIIHPGQWFKRDTGNILEITADIIRSAYQAFKDGLPKYINVPAGGYHPDIVPAEQNRGFVEKLKMIGERLFAGFRFTDPATKAGVEDGSIADVSVYLEPDATHATTGKVYDWILTHVLLTNDPLVQDLEPFGAPLPASADGTRYQVTHYAQKQEVTNMAENISAEAQALLEFAEAKGLTASDVQAMLDERATALAALQATREKARGLEITRIVRALEGVETHDEVVQVEHTRHWPVVIAALETALREQPATMALSADDDGATSLDAVLLAVVNAIPAEGRKAIETQPTGAKEHEDPTLDEPRQFTDEEIKEYAESLHPSRGAMAGVR